jgi:hypothetical protein
MLVVALATFIYIDAAPFLVLAMWSSLSLHGVAIAAYDYYLIDYLNM